MHYKLPPVFEPQPEGGFTVTSPLLPELVDDPPGIAEQFMRGIDENRPPGQKLFEGVS